MRYTSKDLKTMSRLQLTGKYSTYIGALILYQIINSIVNTIVRFMSFGSSITYQTITSFSTNINKWGIYFLSVALFSLILSIVHLGFNKMFLDGSRGYPVRFQDLFYGFRHHPDRIILMTLLLGLIDIVCLLPGYLVLFLSLLFESSIAVMLLGILLLIAGLILTIYFTITFSQAPFLMADYDDLGPVQALKESQRMMSGNKGRYFYLSMSFIGLYLLGILTCGIGYLWIVPYTSMTQTNFYRNISGEI